MLVSFIDFREEEILITFILVAYWTAGISNMAHIVGGIVGAIIGYGLNVK